MSAQGVLLLTAAGIAVFAGMAWERARNALRLVQRARGSLDTLQSNARREQGRAVFWVAIAGLVLYYMARHS